MSQNKPEVPGKRSNEQTLHGKATHFSLGDETLKGAQSTTSHSFAGMTQPRVQPCKPLGTQINLGSDSMEYKSQTQSTVVGMPKDFVRARPLRERQDLVKTNYSVS
jgi:hypothetical protein